MKKTKQKLIKQIENLDICLENIYINLKAQSERLDKLEQTVFKEVVLVEEQPEAIDWNKPQYLERGDIKVLNTGNHDNNNFEAIFFHNEYSVELITYAKEGFKPFKGTINIE